jgi:hypothetical protein
MVPDENSELLSAYLDGELGARQRKEVARLLEGSPEARALLGKLERDAQVLRQLSPCKVPFDLSGTILANIAAEGITPSRLPEPVVGRPTTRRRFPIWTRYAAAAAVLLAVSLGLWLKFGGAGQGPADVAQVPSIPSDNPVKAPETVAEADTPIGPEVPHRPGSQSVFAFPNRQATELHAAKARIPLIQLVRELEPPVLLDQLQAKAKDNACRVDLYCSQPGKCLEQLGLAFAGQSIRINVDPATVERLERQPQASLVLYVENVMPREAAALLQDLSATEKTRVSSHFSTLVVNAGPVTAEDLAHVLGGAARDFAPPSQRPVELGTVGEIVHALPGQGRGGDRTIAKDPYRLAVVVPHETAARDRCSEVQALLDGYREARPGAMALLLVLWNKP